MADYDREVGAILTIRSRHYREEEEEQEVEFDKEKENESN